VESAVAVNINAVVKIFYILNNNNQVVGLAVLNLNNQVAGLAVLKVNIKALMVKNPGIIFGEEKPKNTNGQNARNDPTNRNVQKQKNHEDQDLYKSTSFNIFTLNLT
jgi:hypothetical protein